MTGRLEWGLKNIFLKMFSFAHARVAQYESEHTNWTLIFSTNVLSPCMLILCVCVFLFQVPKLISTRPDRVIISACLWIWMRKTGGKNEHPKMAVDAGWDCKKWCVECVCQCVCGHEHACVCACVHAFCRPGIKNDESWVWKAIQVDVTITSIS